MQANALIFSLIFLSGCATQAPDLPRFQSSNSSIQNANQSSGNYQYNSASPQESTLALITRPVWAALKETERESIKETFEFRILETESYGTIIDVQSQDQSRTGSTAGAALGGAAASSLYIDRAVRGGSYSATNNLAIGVLGALAGSTLDSAPTTQFQFRYTIRLGDGEIRYFDDYSSKPFRHSIGVCITIPELNLISQSICNQTTETLWTKTLAPTIKRRAENSLKSFDKSNTRPIKQVQQASDGEKPRVEAETQ